MRVSETLKLESRLLLTGGALNERIEEKGIARWELVVERLSRIARAHRNDVIENADDKIWEIRFMRIDMTSER